MVHFMVRGWMSIKSDKKITFRNCIIRKAVRLSLGLNEEKPKEGD